MRRAPRTSTSLALERELRWLGLDWDEGPGREAGHGPYRQSQRGGVYAPLFERLEREDRAYPCFCTARGTRAPAPRAAGLGPAAALCRNLRRAVAERARRARRGRGARVAALPRSTRTALQFETSCTDRSSSIVRSIGDFVIRREDGTPAFFFANAVDDSLMQVTQVLRGEDHLANTPRQLLLLEALELRLPRYGHLPLLTGADGAPLSKRNGAQSCAICATAGYGAAGDLQPAVPARPLEQRARLADAGGNGRAFRAAPPAARQRPFRSGAVAPLAGPWVRSLPPQAALDWLAPCLPPAYAASAARGHRGRVAAQYRGRGRCRAWLPVICGGELQFEDEARAAVGAAGPDFFRATAAAVGEQADLRGHARGQRPQRRGVLHAAARRADRAPARPGARAAARAMSPQLVRERLASWSR